MLSHEALIDLYRTLREEDVLSVYIDGRASEFSERDLWKKRFEKGLGEVRKGVGENSGGQGAAFEKALKHIQRELNEFDGYLPNRGWVGFATAEKLWYAEPVRVPMPDLVRWEKGIRVAPYVRALKQSRPVVTVLVDNRRGRIFHYQHGELSEPVDVVVDEIAGDLTDVNISKRATSRSGVRGKTGTDAAQRVLQVEAHRLKKHLVSMIEERAGEQGLVVMGGTPEGVSALREQLPQGLRTRASTDSRFHLEMSGPEVRSMSEEAASRLTQSLQESLLEEVIGQAHSGRKGALGRESVEKVLEESRVETLLLSRNFIREHSDVADHLVGAAFQQHADVEELSLEGAERLDQEGDGVAARLRFTIREGEYQQG